MFWKELLRTETAYSGNIFEEKTVFLGKNILFPMGAGREEGGVDGSSEIKGTLCSFKVSGKGHPKNF